MKHTDQGGNGVRWPATSTGDPDTWSARGTDPAPVTDTVQERLTWRLTPAAPGGSGFEVSLDATRRESANDDAEHGVMLRSRMRW